MNNINPFHLLGVKVDSDIKDVRRAYYKLSLICHPDKGGSKDDMIIVHNAYKYVKKQIEFSENKETLENIEEDFKSFFEKNKMEVPPFYELWERSEEAEFLREFNKKFEENMEINNLINNNVFDVFSVGYGEFLEKRETEENSSEKREKELKKPLQNNFKSELVIYEEPVNLPNDYGEYERFDIEKLDDFSEKTKELNLYDYKKAHSEVNEMKVDEDKINCDVNKAFERILEERK